MVSVRSGTWATLMEWKTVVLKPQSKTEGTSSKKMCRQSEVSGTALVGMPSVVSTGLVKTLFRVTMIKFMSVTKTEARMVCPITPRLPWLTVPVTIMPELSDTLTNRPSTRSASGIPELIVVTVRAFRLFEKPLTTIAVTRPDSRLKTSAVVMGKVNRGTPCYSELAATLTRPDVALVTCL